MRVSQTQELWAEDFGALPDNGDVGSELQLALDKAYDLGGAVVHLHPGTYHTSQKLVLKSTVSIIGSGRNSTSIRQTDNANLDAVLETYNFGTLTGNNKWLVSAGVQYGFVLSGFRIDGNRSNQSGGLGYGFRTYAKGWISRDFLITETYGPGMWTECGAVGGQTDYKDLPECSIELWIKSTGGIGAEWRGPHDAVLQKVDIASTVGNCINFVSSATYDGACDIVELHAYDAVGGIGVNVGAKIKFLYLCGESTDLEGIYFDGSKTDKVMGATAEAYNCGRTAAPNTHPCIYVGAPYTQINASMIRDTNGCDGIWIDATNTKIGFDISALAGHMASAVGLRIMKNGVQAQGSVRNYDAVGDTGFILTAGLRHVTTDIYINNVSTFFNNLGGGAGGNRIRIQGSGSAGQIAFTGTSPDADHDVWDFNVDIAGTQFLSHQVIVSDGTTYPALALDSVGVKNGAVNHTLIATPSQRHSFITTKRVAPFPTDFSLSFSPDIKGVTVNTATWETNVLVASATVGAKANVYTHVGITAPI